MKVKAEKVDTDVVALLCRPWFGVPHIVYAYWNGHRWSLSSGRYPSRVMLNAIDELPFGKR